MTLNVGLKCVALMHVMFIYPSALDTVLVPSLHVPRMLHQPHVSQGFSVAKFAT